MMNTANATATNINAATTATIMKTTSQQAALSLQTSGIIPAAATTTTTTIITNNDRLSGTNNINNSITNQLQNHEHTNSTSQPVTAFTIHASSQSLQTLPNNLSIGCSTASSVHQTSIPAVPTNASIIHPASIGLSGSTVASSVVCTATILPASVQQVTAFPVGVTGVPTVSVLKAQPSVALPIAQRFQTTNITSSGQPTGPINTLFIHQDQHSKGQTVAHSTSTPHHSSHIQPNSVINATVSLAGPTVTVHQPIPSAHTHTTPASLFIQTNNPTQNSAILHTNIPATGHASSAQIANLSTINLSTSAAQQQQLQSQQQAQQQAQQQQFQRLKVEDALSYLDQVKFKFNDQPQVYNDFLDIMKEFKSQSIDTPGVIQRVSTLFKGHPELIVGFNTFLPPGYKIEIHSNDQVNVSMPNSTNVVLMSTNPMGIQTALTTTTIVSGPSVHQQIPGNLPRNAIVSASPSATSNVNLHQAQHQSLPQAYSNSIQPRESASTPLASLANNAVLSQPRTDPHVNRSVSHPLDTANSRQSLPQSNASANNVSMPNNAAQPGSQPVEFNHAINYVNKIKNRFQAQPEVYKQFLDILQNYQKEQRVKDTAPSGPKLLTESEVFTKVAKLFQHQEDLLQEFSQFLPDATGSSGSANAHAHSNSNLLSVSSHGGALNSINSANVTGSNFTLPLGSQPVANFAHTVPHLEGIGSPFPGPITSISNNEHGTLIKKTNMSNSTSAHSNRTSNSSNSPNAYQNTLTRVPKRPSGGLSSNNQLDQNSSVPIKRSKIAPLRDLSSSISDVGNKYIGDLVEYAFFDKLRVSLNSPSTYESFLRALVLFSNDILTRAELVQVVTPVFVRCPDLFKRFKDMIGAKEGGGQANSVNHSSHHNSYSSSLYNNSYSNNSYYSNSYSANNNQLEGLSHRVALMKDRYDTEYPELDFSSCKRYGVSYRTLPKNSARMECSGRTALCHEVLNDTLVSFPSWSEDSTFVSSRKTQYEEYIYRCEDERYELDHVLETNSATLQLFDALMKKISAMSEDERENFRLDDTLGGSSEVIYKKAIRRLYGEHSSVVIEGLKSQPAKTIPMVSARLNHKEEEWREAQKQFNKLWREQLEKYYLKSLDHQGINFKQNDIKNLRTKSLLNEIETIFDNRQSEQSKPATESNQQLLLQPHLVYVYPDKSMIDVACNLIIHHVKRQTSIHKEDKQKIKQLMRHFIPDFFATPRGELSDDEFDEELEKPTELPTKSTFDSKKSDEKDEEKDEKVDIKPPSMLNSKPDEEYSLFYVNDYWYYFFRLHYILCERLSKMHKHALNLAAEEASQKLNKESSPSTQLRLRNNLDIEMDDYFSSLVDMVKQVLDGNLDSNQYEDTLREMFGIHAYIAFTLDKVVSYIVRQLQHIVTDDVSQSCREMFLEAIMFGDYAGGLCETAHQRVEDEAFYQKRAEQVMSDEHCFRIIIYKDEGKVTFEMLASNEEEESANEGDEESTSTQSSRTLRSSAKRGDKWNELGDAADIEGLAEKLDERLKEKPLFLRRCIRKYKSTTGDDNDTKDLSSSEKTASAEDDEKMSGDEKTPKDSTDLAKPEKSDSHAECELKLDSFRSVLVVTNDSILYRRNALTKARQSHKKVYQNLYDKFNKWHTSWAEANCTQEQMSKCKSWFLSSDTTNWNWNSKEKPDTAASSINTTASEASPGLREHTPKSDANEGKLSSESTSSPTPATGKTLHRMTIDTDSRPPYRSYCKYHLQ